ncbi:outer membrane biogenesis protein BamB [Planctomycetes bacterium Pan216]|uniref:Outer membrane biogenesis protein BamB n=2 Tax=Kolteria novifilia TaxID=2527975 RepID=A0A518B8I4_9BACT|nr:outer membrane biogenesis protein BamB [Planctomycetes bacterium Pan216]
MRNLLSRAITAVALLSTIVPLAQAENWPSWRGDGSGISKEKGLPTEWDRKTNVNWFTKLPERGNSTPVIWGDCIFLTQPISADNRRTLMCFDKSTGKLLWNEGVVHTKPDKTHQTNPHCSPSPVTDGERVIVWFGSAGVVCYDMNGKELWRRDLGDQDHVWGTGSSPVLFEDLCILNFGPGKNAFVVALDKKTGETVWKVDIPAEAPASNDQELSDKQRRDRDVLRGSWVTPLVIDAGGRKELIVHFPEKVVALDPSTGKELWTCDGIGPLAYASPMWGNGVLVAWGGYFGPSLAVRPGGSGDVTQTHRLWHKPKSKLRLGTGVIRDGHIYINDMKGIAQCIDLETGDEIWTKRLRDPKSQKGDSWSSFLMADGLVYALNQAGTTFVLEASPEYRLVATNPLEEVTNSTVVASDGSLFIRTHEGLWSIGEESRKSAK